jgi:hypothetical protein
MKLVLTEDDVLNAISNYIQENIGTKIAKEYIRFKVRSKESKVEEHINEYYLADNQFSVEVTF